MTNEENNIENDDIAGLLGSLKRVDAPGDFDFRVRARLAAGRPRAAWLPLAGRLAVPAALALLIAGYFGFRAYQAPVSHEASIVPVPVLEQAAPLRPPVPFSSEAVPVADHPTEIAAKPPTGRNRHDNIPAPVRHKVPSETYGGGSVDMASGISNPLSAIGAETSHSGSSWTVGEVKQNSVAERSGLKAGDVVVKVTGRTVLVRRDGKIVRIPLKP